MKDIFISSTDLLPYSLVVLTEFAPFLYTSAKNHIKDSGLPVFIVSYWDHAYAQDFGLVDSWLDCDDWPFDYCESWGVTDLWVEQTSHPITDGLADPFSALDSSATVYDVDTSDLEPGVTPLVYSDHYKDRAAVFVDEARKYVVMGNYNTTRFTDVGWKLFDAIIGYVHKRVVFEDGFESGGLEGWGHPRGGVQVSADAAHTGQYGLQLEFSDGSERPIIGLPIDVRGLDDLTLKYAVSTAGDSWDVLAVEVWSPSMSDTIVVDTVTGTTRWEEREIIIPREAHNKEYLWITFSYYELTSGGIEVPKAALDAVEVSGKHRYFAPLSALTKDDEQSTSLFKPLEVRLTYRDQSTGFIETDTYELESGDPDRRPQLGECEWNDQPGVLGLHHACCSQWTVKVDELPVELKTVSVIASSEQEICRDLIYNSEIMPMSALRDPTVETVPDWWFDASQWKYPEGTYLYEQWEPTPTDWVDFSFGNYCSECVGDCPSGTYNFELVQEYEDIVGGFANFNVPGPAEDPDVLYWMFDQPLDYPSQCLNVNPSNTVVRWLVKIRLTTN